MHLSGSCCRIRHTWKPPRRECSTRSKISVRRVAFPKWSMGIRSTGIEDPEQWGTSEVVWGHCQEQRPRTTYSCHFNFYLEMMKKNNHQSTLEPWSDLCTNQVKKLWHQFYNNRTSSAKCFRLYPTVRKKKNLKKKWPLFVLAAKLWSGCMPRGCSHKIGYHSFFLGEDIHTCEFVDYYATLPSVNYSSIAKGNGGIQGISHIHS